VKYVWENSIKWDFLSKSKLMQSHVYCNRPCKMSGSINIADFFDQTIDPQILQNNVSILLIIVTEEKLRISYGTLVFCLFLEKVKVWCQSRVGFRKQGFSDKLCNLVSHLY
jgi:hypothetical protein